MSTAKGASRMLPSPIVEWSRFVDLIGDRKLVVFLDYDGSLTPIVDDPSAAHLDPATRLAIDKLSTCVPVAVVSGRDVADVRDLVAVKGIWYSGSHGFDVIAPNGDRRALSDVADYLAALDTAQVALEKAVAESEGIQVERKRYAIAVHYRRAGDGAAEFVERIVADVVAADDRLRRTTGKMIQEVRPRLPWDKGKALLWMLTQLQVDSDPAVAIYLGDDDTDEDAFRELQGDGIGVLVADEERPSAATWSLRDPAEVQAFLARLAGWCLDRS